MIKNGLTGCGHVKDTRGKISGSARTESREAAVWCRDFEGGFARFQVVIDTAAEQWGIECLRYEIRWGKRDWK